MRAPSILVFWLAVCSPLAAHDLWLEPLSAGFELRYGHAHSAHEGEAALPYAPDFVQGAYCQPAMGPVQSLDVRPAYPARFPADCDGLLVEASSGAWSTTVEGKRNVSPEGLPGVIRSWRSVESTKRINHWNAALSTPMSDGLELVPLQDPFAVGVGRKLRLLVTLDGQPRAGVSVAYAGETRGVTGSDGRLNLRLRDPGLQLIAASLRVPMDEGPVEAVVHATTLHFTLE